MVKTLMASVFLILLISCGSNSSTPDVDNNLPVAQSVAAPQPITFTIDSVFPHDANAFTQGLEYYKGKLYEGTGEPNQSTLRIVNIKTGKPEKQYLIPDSTIFGEGITIFKNKIYQLTWQSHKIFEYNVTDIMHPLNTYNWGPEGWGMTNDGHNIIISDGTSKLYYVQPDPATKQMKPIKTLTVVDNNGELDSLNELEYINGYVYANRWYNNHIIKVDTSNGHVVGILDFTGLMQQYDPNYKLPDSAVLNGIAYDSATKKMYITGKDWPKMFQVQMNN